MNSKELKIKNLWPRTLRYIISPEISSYLWGQTIDFESFTIGLTPFIINYPRLVERHIKNVTDQWIAFGAWW